MTRHKYPNQSLRQKWVTICMPEWLWDKIDQDDRPRGHVVEEALLEAGFSETAKKVVGMKGKLTKPQYGMPTGTVVDVVKYSIRPQLHYIMVDGTLKPVELERI